MRNLRLLLFLVFALIAFTLFDSNNFFSENLEINKVEKEQEKSIKKITNTPIPTTTPIKSSPTLSQAPANSTPLESINNFIYPNSSNITGDENLLSMESLDQPQIITDWYKEKIKAMGMKATTFVQTTTNGNVLNKLAGANNSFGIVVEIKKGKDDTKTSIRLTFKD